MSSSATNASGDIGSFTVPMSGTLIEPFGFGSGRTTGCDQQRLQHPGACAVFVADHRLRQTSAALLDRRRGLKTPLDRGAVAQARIDAGEEVLAGRRREHGQV